MGQRAHNSLAQSTNRRCVFMPGGPKVSYGCVSSVLPLPRARPWVLTRSLTLALSAMVGPQGDRCASAAPSGIVHNGLDAFPALVPLDKDPPAMIRAGFQGCGTFKYGYGGSCATLVLVGTRGGEKGAIGGNQQQRNKRQYWGITTWNSRYAMDCIWLFRGPTPLPLLSGGSGGSIATVDQRMTLIS